MGRTIPSWRIIVEEEITRMSKFKQFLGPDDRVVFDDLLSQCKLYAAEAGLLASPVKEVPLLLSMISYTHFAKLDPAFLLLDGLLHGIIEQNPPESILKFIHYNLPKLASQLMRSRRTA
jgi:hypothetical protein